MGLEHSRLKILQKTLMLEVSLKKPFLLFFWLFFIMNLEYVALIYDMNDLNDSEGNHGQMLAPSVQIKFF